MSSREKFEAQTHQTEIGQKVSVERHDVSSELSSRGNSKLRDLGEEFNPMAEHLDYKGSAAIHIYQSKMLGQIFFISQVQTLQDVPEPTAGTAMANLRGDMMEFFGRNRQKKRSGF